MPKEVSKLWLKSSQNAFLAEKDPRTGSKWAPRKGLVYGKGFRHGGVIEPFLKYKKLHRTGKLFKSLKVRANKRSVQLYSTVPYAVEHELGLQSGKAKVGGQYLIGGASGAAVGGKLHARPFMRPSHLIRRAPVKLLMKQLDKLGWR